MATIQSTPVTHDNANDHVFHNGFSIHVLKTFVKDLCRHKSHAAEMTIAHKKPQPFLCALILVQNRGFGCEEKGCYFAINTRTKQNVRAFVQFTLGIFTVIYLILNHKKRNVFENVVCVIVVFCIGMKFFIYLFFVGHVTDYS